VLVVVPGFVVRRVVGMTVLVVGFRGRLVSRVATGFGVVREVDRRGRDIFGRRFRRRRDGFGMMFSRSSVPNVLRGLVAVMMVVILLAMIVMVMMMVVIVVIIVVRVTMIAMVSGFGTLVRLREIMRTVRVAGVVVGLCDLRRLLALGDLDHLALHAFTAAAAARVAMARAAPVRALFGFFFRFAMGAFVGLDQRLPIGNGDLIIVRMNFAEGEEAVAVAAVFNEGSL
jgi:hypothetical protein